jgi:hypothetical protein
MDISQAFEQAIEWFESSKRKVEERHRDAEYRARQEVKDWEKRNDEGAHNMGAFLKKHGSLLKKSWRVGVGRFGY